MSKRWLLAAGTLILALLIGAALMVRDGQVGAAPTAVATGIVEVAGDSMDVGVIPEEAALYLEQGRLWRAARALREYLGESDEPAPETVLLAARTEAEWGGWSAAREYLEGAAWLDEVGRGEGWYWLGRAREEEGAYPEALEAYDRFLSLRGGEQSERAAIAALRRGLVLLRLGQRDAGTEALGAVEERAPYIEDWMGLLAGESAAEGGDTTLTRSAIDGLPAAAGMRHRGRKALIRAYEVANDPAGGIAVATAFRAAGGTQTERADLSTAAGRLALEIGENEVARRELRASMSTAPGSSAAREAASLLLRVPNLTTEDRLAIAEIDDRHGNPSRAAEGYRAVLESGELAAGRVEQIRLALGRAQFGAGQNAAAEATLRGLIGGSPAVARAALLLIGRSEYQRGARTQAFATFDRLAERFPGSAEGSEGLFLIADLQHDDGETAEAARNYRRVASDFRGTDRAGLSLMRLGGIRYLERDYQAAAAIWDEYRSTYPSGERWLQSTYWSARSREAAGDTASAGAMYRSVRERDPLSYYALRASERLRIDYWPIPMAPEPAPDSSAVATVQEWMRGVDLLRDAGLHAEADAETQRLTEIAGSDPDVLYALGEALNERGYAIRGIRLGQQLQQSQPRLNARILRLLYPLPYAQLVEAEAREQGLDPFVVAALIRQESLFTARISSPVGARGLMQIMPETGSALARGADVDEWDAELLFQPEINVHLGTIYLAEQMEEYDGSLPSVFSAYNAGPHRIDAWAEFPEYGDEELFTERIPYRETRDYVKILTRNIALYKGLYGTSTE